MDNARAEIYHLFHSGVAVETGEGFLVFDYYNDTPAGVSRNISSGVLSAGDFSGRNSIYVFVSHNHSDHYNPVIFDWQRTNPGIKYILSDDIQEGLNGENIFFMKKYQNFKLDRLEIKSFGSTDQGLSFLVKTDNLTIFHAGDLNWWHWKEFSREEQEREERDFKEEIAKIEGEEIDIAFIPVDPRLEEYYYLAGDYFARRINPELLIPIHFGDNFGITSRFAGKIEDLPVRAAVIGDRGERIVYEKEVADCEKDQY